MSSRKTRQALEKDLRLLKEDLDKSAEDSSHLACLAYHFFSAGMVISQNDCPEDLVFVIDYSRRIGELIGSHYTKKKDGQIVEGDDATRMRDEKKTFQVIREDFDRTKKDLTHLTILARNCFNIGINTPRYFENSSGYIERFCEILKEYDHSRQKPSQLETSSVGGRE